jgi:hypothetical protein
LVRDRVRYEDLAGLSYTPPNPDRHHRNETLSGIADPQIFLHAGHQTGGWGLSGKAGISVPVGRTEPNPFALGRLGLSHQHIQFGTGTWDPIGEIAVGHPTSVADFQLTGIARTAIGRNEHGYHAGNRYALLLDAGRGLTQSWSGSAGLALLREEAETWDGRIETEGNLGRTDLLLSLGLAHASSALGGFNVAIQFPLYSHVREHQTDIPLILRLGWSP